MRFWKLAPVFHGPGTAGRFAGAWAAVDGEGVKSHPEGTGHPWPCLLDPRRIAGCRPPVRGPVHRPMSGGEERLPEPQSSRGARKRGNVNPARRMTYLCPKQRVRQSGNAKLSQC